VLWYCYLSPITWQFRDCKALLTMWPAYLTMSVVPSLSVQRQTDSCHKLHWPSICLSVCSMQSLISQWTVMERSHLPASMMCNNRQILTQMARVCIHFSHKMCQVCQLVHSPCSSETRNRSFTSSKHSVVLLCQPWRDLGDYLQCATIGQPVQ